MVKVVDILAGYEISYNGAIDIKELQALIRRWCKKNHFDLIEKVYDIKMIENGRNGIMKWEADKKLDDYNQIVVKPDIILTNCKEVKVDGKRILEGDVKVKIGAELNRDYDEAWKGKPMKRFLRGFFDKFFAPEKVDRAREELKKSAKLLRDEVKRYFDAD